MTEDSSLPSAGRRDGNPIKQFRFASSGVTDGEPPYPNRASSTCRWIFPDVLRGSASIATKCTSLGSL